MTNYRHFNDAVLLDAKGMKWCLLSNSPELRLQTHHNLVLVCLLAIYAVAGFVVQGCGGGQPQPQPFKSRQTVQDVSRSFGKVFAQSFGSVGGRGFTSRLRRLSRQATCPNVTINWDFTGTPPDPLIVTVDYGNGCEDEEGDFVKGSFTLVLHNPQFDAEYDLIGGTAEFQFNNFSIEGETINGTFSMEIINELTANVSLNLQYQVGECWERVTLNGTIAFSADETFFTVSGSGTFSASYLGNLQVNYVATNLRFEETCDFPVGGTLRATYNGTTEEWSFPGTCGVGVVSVNGGQPQQVALEDIPSCG
ncbi:hypothetical protein B0813_002189 [Candidatus Fervidibacteria bacterium JGI MDM2 SSWTFF-3-K9]